MTYNRGVKTYVFLLIVIPLLAHAQTTVYYCDVNGKKQITDLPCDKLGGVETKRLQGREDLKKKPDPVFQEVMCSMLSSRKKQMMDDQYYRGKPHRMKDMADVENQLRDNDCPQK